MKRQLIILGILVTLVITSIPCFAADWAPQDVTTEPVSILRIPSPDVFREVDALVTARYPGSQIAQQWAMEPTGIGTLYMTSNSSTFSVKLTWDGAVMVNNIAVAQWDRL